MPSALFVSLTHHRDLVLDSPQLPSPCDLHRENSNETKSSVEDRQHVVSTGEHTRCERGWWPQDPCRADTQRESGEWPQGLLIDPEFYTGFILSLKPPEQADY